MSGLAELFFIMTVGGTGKVFPELYMLVRIAVTLPVTSVSAEVSFSKVKLVETRLRSTMGQERLEDLIVISCDNDIEYDPEAVIDSFAAESTPLRRSFTAQYRFLCVAPGR